MTTSCDLVIKLLPVCTIPDNTSRQTLLELALILPVKLHASSQKRILGLRNTGLLVGIRQKIVVTIDVLIQLHQEAVSIRKVGRIMELTSPIPNGIIIQMNGTSYISQRSPSFFPTQRGSHQKRKYPVTKLYLQM